ncbi:hypothetical protein [uncultured Arthrobacter sp.]|uniref:hypothetical protein n=1 Tax=uncultured Arthrobacter sp. TaxID=114050 RepID=UPI0032162277
MSAAGLTVIAATAALVLGTPASADLSGPRSGDLASQVERSKAREASTAERVGQIEARLAAASARSDGLAVALGQIAVGHLLTGRPKAPRRREPHPPELVAAVTSTAEGQS